jgi:acetyl esterase/lipase
VTDPARIRALLQCRSARALDRDDAGRLLIQSDLTGVHQLYEHTGESLRPLTDLPDPVTGSYLPGSRRAVVALDSGGNERHQLYLLDLDREGPVTDVGTLEPLAVDLAHIHVLAGAGRDGRQVAYLSNRRNGVDFDGYVVDLGTGEHRCVYDAGGWCQPASGFSPDGRWLSLIRPGERPMDADLLLLDVAGRQPPLIPLPHPDEAATVGAPAWVDETTCLVPTNIGRDFEALLRVDVAPGSEPKSSVALAPDRDVVGWTSRNGEWLLGVSNDDGECVAELYRTRDLERVGVLPLPEPGVVTFSLLTPDPLVGDDGEVVVSFSSPRVPGDVWAFAPGGGSGRRLTASPGEPPTGLPAASRHRIPSFDGERIPVALYRPDGAQRPPVVVVVHGGPESQATLGFNPIIAALVSGGYAVAVPNVRGSTGYGRRYYGLDDRDRRLDSVADLAAVHGFLAEAGLDMSRAALWGGSYGGYMVLAGLAFQPELWAAGVDLVGISDLVTFLQNTSDYRRAHREREYGSLTADREFLERASPIRRVADIRAPLFVVHGRNDPRVPVTEAEQLAGSLRERGVPCELVVYPDEGHGLAKLANRLDAYPRAIAFLDRVLMG